MKDAATYYKNVGSSDVLARSTRSLQRIVLPSLSSGSFTCGLIWNVVHEYAQGSAVSLVGCIDGTNI